MAIRILENSVIDQIAAGEVVERPAHMIKEMVENSLDAGATEVTVDFSEGGRRVLIKDNGSGMAPDELPLALARHATSKIVNSDDIWRISSFGFRGEALASISAVSRVRIVSRKRRQHEGQEVGQELGAEVHSEFGRVGDVNPVGAEPGTTIEVRDLFENMPARLKFLKSEGGETAAVKLQLKALALSRPGVNFRVLQQGELAAYWPGTASLPERVKQVLGETEMHSGVAKFGELTANVVVSSPHRTVGNARQIWIFVQGRYVQDRGVQAAVIEAYRQLLMHGEYPVAVIDLRCGPEDVDVNVSPTKSQVKFREPSNVFRVVQRAVRDVLEKAPWRPITSSSDSSSGAVAAGPAIPLESLVRTLQFQDRAIERVQIQTKVSPDQIAVTASAADSSAGGFGSPVDLGSAVGLSAAGASASDRQSWARLEVLGQAQQTYILTQSRSALIIIDQHAAHERVMFERLSQGVKNGSIEVQSFLLPLVVPLPEDAARELIAAGADLARLGLSLELLGPDQVAVQAAPAMLRTEGIPRLVEKLGDEYVRHGGSFSLEKAMSDILATMACHSAIRAGQTLSAAEMRALLEQMDEYPLSSFCPHGRPVYIEYPFQRLERDFGRIV